MTKKIITTAVASFIFLFPLFFLNLTPESYEYNKMFLLIVFSLVMLILYFVKSLEDRHFTVVRSTFGWPLLVITIIVCISSFVQTPNVIIAGTTPLAASTWLAGFLAYFFLVQLTDSGQKKMYGDLLVADGFLISAYTFLLYLGILPDNPFTPSGTLLSTLLFLVSISIYIGIIIYRYNSRRFVINSTPVISDVTTDPEVFSDLETEKNRMVLYALILLPVAAAVLILTYHLFTNQKPAILPYSYGWSIFLEVGKNLKTLLLGVGPTNFQTAFTLTKPQSINMTAYWNVIFTNSSTFFLTLATEAGIIAAAMYIILIVKSVRLALRKNFLKTGTFTGNPGQAFLPVIAAVLFFQLVLPSSMTLFILMICLMGLSADRKPWLKLNLSVLGKISYIFLLLPITFVTLASFFLYRAYAAEAAFKSSLDALLNKDGLGAYRLQLEAISDNPYIDRYHVAFSQTNIALANALAAKKDLTAEDKQNIPKLVQQSVDHARTSIILYRTSAPDWDNLGHIYANLINFAAGSDQWAVTSFQQKILLDPVNPQNHLLLGGLYLSLKKYPEAEIEFKNAISLKPDFASAYYNLAQTLKSEKKNDEALKLLQTTLTLLTQGSADYNNVKKEADDLSALISTPPATPSGQPKKSFGSLEKLETVGTATGSSLNNNINVKPTVSLAEPPVSP